MQSTNPRPGQLVARLTVRKTVVHLVTTLEVYAEPAPSSSVFPPARPGLTKVAPVIELRRAAGSRGFALSRVLGLLAVAAALLVLFSLTACGGADGTGAAPATDVAEAGAPDAPATCEPPATPELPTDKWCYYPQPHNCRVYTSVAPPGSATTCAPELDWSTAIGMACGADCTPTGPH